MKHFVPQQPRRGSPAGLARGAPLLLVALAACGGSPASQPTLKSLGRSKTTGDAAAAPGAAAPATPVSGDATAAVPPAPGVPLPDLTGCGDLLGSAAAGELFKAQLNSLPYTLNGQQTVFGFPVGYVATVSASLTLQASFARIVSTTAVTVRADQTRAQQRAEADAGLGAGVVTSELTPLADRPRLLTDGAWNGIGCVVQPTRRVTAALGAGTVVASFDPPLPTILSPAAAAATYKETLAGARTWGSVEATILQSSNAALASGAKLHVTVNLRPIDPSEVVALGSGQSVTVAGDAAFELALDFDQPGAAAALGLAPVTRYYIDFKSQSFKAVVVEPTAPAGGAGTPPPPVAYTGG